MKHIEDYKFTKFSNYLITEKEKDKIFKLYENLNSASKKRLFLYLNYIKSREIIRDILLKDGVLTIDGITHILFNDSKIFQTEMNFVCNNINCENSQGFESKRIKYKKCPKCAEKCYLNNSKELLAVYRHLYLDYYDFYILNDVDSTVYLIYNKYADKFYLKKGDESFSNWIYLKLVENNCDVLNFLFFANLPCKNPKNEVLKYIKEKGYIKHIDNLNFKPVNEKTFKEELKQFFNIYSGNENLNKVCLNKNINFEEDCSNIKELMLNLTSGDLNGVNYLLDVLAMILQEPHIKTKQLIIFYGEEASGKGTFYDLILHPLFEGYITKILGKKIKSTFNGFMSKNLVLVLEEVKADKEEEDTLKELVTEDKILINEKNMPERYENNYLTIFGFSNEMNPINAGKRRGVYFRSRTLGGSTDKAPEYRKKYEQEIPKEFPILLNHLKNRNYDRLKVMKGYDTEAKKQVMEQNMSLIERFFSELCNYETLGKYVSEMINQKEIDCNLDLSRFLYKFEETNYVHASFILDLYNIYLKKNKYSTITLNKFSLFWQLVKIDRENKDHWRRLINPDNEKKTQYINIDIINEEIKKRYDEE